MQLTLGAKKKIEVRKTIEMRMSIGDQIATIETTDNKERISVSFRQTSFWFDTYAEFQQFIELMHTFNVEIGA